VADSNPSGNLRMGNEISDPSKYILDGLDVGTTQGHPDHHVTVPSRKYLCCGPERASTLRLRRGIEDKCRFGAPK